MNKKIIDQIATRVSAVESGSFTNDDLRLLLIDLRALLPRGAQHQDSRISHLYDIFDVAAHPNKRDRGRAFKASEKIIDQFVKAVAEGGTVRVDLLALNVADSLCAVLDVLQLPYDKGRVEMQQEKLKLEVYHLLDQVEIDTKNDAIETASIHYDPDQKRAFISFKMKPFHNKIGNLTISGSPTMRFPLI